jgi:hypothetical protein
MPCMAERMFSTELGCCILVLRELVLLMNFWSAILGFDVSKPALLQAACASYRRYNEPVENPLNGLDFP